MNGVHQDIMNKRVRLKSASGYERIIRVNGGFGACAETMGTELYGFWDDGRGDQGGHTGKLDARLVVEVLPD